MKSLKLTILLDQGVSKADLANVFGQFYTYTVFNRYVQFSFPSIRMLTSMQLKPIYNLLLSYEQKNPLRFKMFHLSDEDGLFSPIYLQCYRGLWNVVSVTAGEMKSSTNLLTLI